MPRIELTNVTKRWKNFYAVEDLNMVIEDNAFITLLGPSGCGKTTTLRMIAGLETPTSGRITIGDQVVFDSEKGINVPANERHVGFLFQNYALWPNMTVYQNITFGLQNVVREMPVMEYEVVTKKQIIDILNDYNKVIELIETSKNKDGKVDEKKALLKIVDTYIVSMITAKKVYALKLNTIDNKDEVVKTTIAKLTEEIATIQSKLATKGLKALEDGTVVDSENKPIIKKRKLYAEEIDLAVRKVSRIVKVGMFMDRYPAELSGGQQQRVAIARTLAPEPKVLFMDEPLSNLDAKLRLEMRYELQRLHVDTGATFVYVTHDQMEAMTLATKICLINNGVLQQYDAPLTVYNRPNNTFVADFVGNPSINFIEAKGSQTEDGIELSFLNDLKATFIPDEKINLEEWYQARDKRLQDAKQRLEEKLADKKYVEKGNKDEVFKYNIAKVDEEDDTLKVDYTPVNGDFVIGIRPEAFSIEEKGLISAEIHGAMPTGMESTLKIKYNEFLLTSVVFGGTEYKIGTKVNLNPTGSVKLFDRVSGEIIATGKFKLD